MADPLDALRLPSASADPDPAFAAALRARLERALLAPEETMTDTVTSSRRPETTAGATAGEPNTISAYLAVLDARASVEFYVGALGATRRGEPIVMPDGRVGHVEVAIGNSVLMLSDEHPELGLEAPVTRGGPSQSLHLETPDPDAVVAAALARGARLERPVADGPYGRAGVVVDPDGHRWMISRPPAAARPGDVVYASLWAPDAARTLAFYPRVLGWRPQGRRVPDVGLGTWGGQDVGLNCCYLVPDADAAAAVVRAAGGRAGEPSDEPYGRVVDCVDDQGVPFALMSGSAPPLPGGQGSLAYAELRVPDAVRARAFYGTVLGWRFTPGGEDGYWHVLDTGPMIGLAGGHATASVVPWFRVGDVAAAAAEVRAAGGIASEPVGSRHGTEVACVDDQGAPFTLVAG